MVQHGRGHSGPRKPEERSNRNNRASRIPGKEGVEPFLDPAALEGPLAALAGSLSNQEADRLKGLVQELDRRQQEALKLYAPMPAQWRFHRSMARQRTLTGSNRSGKTCASVAELAWALCGSHPVEGKYPKENGRAFVVARDLDKVGEVIWRKLGRPGAFRILRDQATGQWRAARPEDGTRGKAAPPLLPRRLIKDIAWEHKKKQIPSKVILHNGWECSFYSSKSDPEVIQGVDMDIILFDEEVVNEGWYSEAMARLIDRMGWFWWSATPQVGTQQLYELHLRAEGLEEEAREFEREHPRGEGDPPPEPRAVEEFPLSIWDNAFLSDRAKRDFEASLDEQERATRIDGVYAISGTRVFESTFYPRGIHGIDPFPIPPTWARFCAIDPGFQVAAVLFAAIPPPKWESAFNLDPGLYGDFVYLYDEIYLRSCDAKTLAKAFVEHVGDQEMHSHLLDHHGGMLTEIGTGKTPEQQYREAFKAAKVKLPQTGVLFTYGSDDVAGGILRIKDWLRVRPDGTTKLRFLRGAVGHTISNLERYSWKVVQGEITDKPVKKNDHQCLVAGTMVETDRGPVPIERIGVGDMVLTRRGYRTVLASMMTAESAEVVTVRFSDGGSLTGTGNHPVMTAEGDLAGLDCLRYGTIVQGIANNRRLARCQVVRRATGSKSFRTRGSSSGVTPIRRIVPIGCTSPRDRPIDSGVSCVCTRKSGPTSTGRSLRAIRSTTRTRTRRTTIRGTWSVSPPRNIVRFTGRPCPKRGRRRLASILMRSVPWRRRGIPPRPDSNCIPGTGRRTGRAALLPITSASIAARSTNPGRSSGSSIARSIAGPPPGGLPASTISPSFARDAAKSSRRTDTVRRVTVPVSVLGSYAGPDRVPVYNLTVEGEHEYFANGILVSNCDNLRYLCMYPNLNYHKPKLSAAPKPEAAYEAWKSLKVLEKRLRKRAGKADGGVTLA